MHPAIRSLLSVLAPLATALVGGCSSDTVIHGPETTLVYCGYVTGPGCACKHGNLQNDEDCSILSTKGGRCCADDRWPSAGTCDCLAAVTWTCAVDKKTGACRCGPGVTPTSAETSTTSCSGGTDVRCCTDAGACRCSAGLTCTGSSKSIDVCGGPQPRACGEGRAAVDACRSSKPVCADKGWCSPTQNACGCGLACIHLNAGSYTCGDACTKDADCTGKQDPASGLPYKRCAAGTLGSFCS